MRICLVYQEDYPWDIRVEKVANALSNAGHEVFLVCRNESRSLRYQEQDDIKISRLPALPQIFGRLNQMINFPAFFNPLWLLAISRCVKRNKIDLIIVRDLPLALTAIAVGKFYKIPVLLDMAECYPELLRCLWKFGRYKFSNLFVRNPYLADLVEQISIKNTDHIFVVVEESKERLLAMGVGPERISIISNTPPLNKFVPRSELHDVKGLNTDIRMIYVGLVTRTRGLDTVLEGLSYFLKDYGIPVSLTIIGTGEAEDEYKGLAKSLGINKWVQFKGWLDNTSVPPYILSSHIGLVPHHICGHWDHTIPNKLFDYMASGLPVLSSNTRAASRIVQETECGLLYEDFNPKSFSSRLMELTNESKRLELGENGRKAILKKYNWEIESKELLKVITTFERDQMLEITGVSA
jgi:glycosyltransferase involved in cell wall biosynthesis